MVSRPLEMVRVWCWLLQWFQNLKNGQQQTCHNFLIAGLCFYKEVYVQSYCCQNILFYSKISMRSSYKSEKEKGYYVMKGKWTLDLVLSWNWVEVLHVRYQRCRRGRPKSFQTSPSPGNSLNLRLTLYLLR